MTATSAPLYVKTDADNLASLLRTLDPAGVIGYFDVSYSALGGEDRASIIVRATSEKKEAWINGILHNAHYGMFHLAYDGKIELFAKHHECPKFRKCKVKSLRHAAEKIVAYFQSL
jgi:hypothetical protein